MWPHVRPLLFYSGETSDIQDIKPRDENKKSSKPVDEGVTKEKLD